jgi:hypothetical protein
VALEGDVVKIYWPCVDTFDSFNQQAKVNVFLSPVVDTDLDK